MAVEPWTLEIAGIIRDSNGLDELDRKLGAWQERKTEDTALADPIYASGALAWMAGNLFVRTIEAPHVASHVKLQDLRVGASGEFLSLPFAEAIENFAARKVVSPEVVYSALGKFRNRAFTASNLATKRLRQVAYDQVKRALEGGSSFEQFANELIKHGATGLGISTTNPYYLRLVFDQNVTSSYAAGRYQQLSDEQVKEAMPWRMYVAVMDGRTRDEHAELNGKTWAADDPEWEEYMPPTDFQCRCTMVSLEPDDDRLDKRELDRSVSHPNPDFRGPPSILIDEDA